MAKRKNRGIAVLTMLMLGLSIIVLGLLADTRPASASDEDCLLLVLDSVDGVTPTAGITVQFVDREGETHTYETNENGLVLVPCGLLGDSLMFEDTWGHGFCMVLNPERAHEGPLNSLLIDHPELGIVSAPQASVTPYGTVLRLGLGPGSEDPVQS